MDVIKKLEIAIKAMDSKKAQDIEAIHVRDLTIIADYFLLCSGTSSTQVKAIAEEVEYRLSENGVEPGHIEGRSTSWILLDYGALVIHVFKKDTREFYKMERLWGDAEKMDISPYLGKGES